MEVLPDDTCADWLERCLVGDQKSDTEEVTGDLDSSNYGDKTNEDRKGTYTRLRSASKPHSTPLTLKWLEENYEIAEGVCIPRSTLYVHYLDYCEKHDTQPVNAASFGKIIRQQFPQLTTRRLGTRGQSKYHYYGIGVRENSQYYEVSYSAKGIQSSVDGKKDNAKQIIAYSPRSKLGTLLPDFPDMKDIKLPASVAEDKVLTFLMMYRTHCQRILDTVIRANFDEVQSFLLHFWQGMPTHIKSILECKVLVTLVGVCDSILYRAIANVLMPTVLQPLPESLTQVIRKFSIQLDEWLHQALDSLPYNLQKVKFDLARRFSQVLKRQTSLNHLCQAARTVIHSADITSQMLDDWINVDLNSIIKQTLYTMDNHCDMEQNVIVKLTRDFEMLLEDQAPLESYIEWLDCMVDQCVVQKSRKQLGTLKKTARQFLLMWSCFGTRVIRDMTLHSAPSFGSFHLLHLMFDEYVLYLVENLHNQEKGDELLRAVRGEQNLDFLDDIIMMEPQTGNTQSRDTDRTSVIRIPECNVQNSGHHVSLPDYTSHTDTACFQQPVICTDHRNEGLGSGPFPAFPHIGTSSFSQETVSRPKNSFTNHNPQGLLGGHLPELLSGNHNAVNNYDWYDWSNTGQTPPSAPNVMLNKVPNMDQHLLYKSPSHFDYSSSDNQHFSPFCNEVDLNLKRSVSAENQSFLQTAMQKRKLDDSSKLTMTDIYSYQHVTNVM